MRFSCFTKIEASKNQVIESTLGLKSIKRSFLSLLIYDRDSYDFIQLINLTIFQTLKHEKFCAINCIKFQPYIKNIAIDIYIIHGWTSSILYKNKINNKKTQTKFRVIILLDA